MILKFEVEVKLETVILEGEVGALFVTDILAYK